MTRLVLYARAGCHLCDEARVLLERLADELGFALGERDIDADERLQRAYFERVPVVTVDGEEACEGIIREQHVRAALRARGRGGRQGGDGGDQLQ